VRRSCDAEKLKLSSDGGDSGSKKRGCGDAYGGVWRSLLLVGALSLESGGLFCVGEFGRNRGFSRHEDVFSSGLMYFIKTFYKFCTFNAICKDNAAMNCITVQHTKKKGSFPSTLTGLTALVGLYLKS
jgi:hypothetical protein